MANCVRQGGQDVHRNFSSARRRDAVSNSKGLYATDAYSGHALEMPPLKGA